MTIFGYVRVSTTGQNEDRQLITMQELNEEIRIFTDKQSGKDFDRPQYKKMIRQMKKGDLLYVVSLDRLGRNYTEIKEQWRILTHKKGIDICILDMKPILDTRASKDLFGTVISDLVLSILSFCAENERTYIRQRQAEGIAAARARGVHLGRRRNPVPHNFNDIIKRWENGELKISEVLKICNMKESTFYRRLRELRQSENMT
ncbi:MAG: recombinase family protein [Blautia sp.]|nr:recombinase family protein [Blautia sp.]